MHRRSLSLVAAIACCCLVLLALAASASAAITATSITSPADNSYFLQEASGPVAEVTVQGTVESTGKPGSIELRCYSDPEDSEPVEEIEEEELKEVKPKGSGKYTFSVTIPIEEFGESPCVLRAVPEGTKTFLPPGVSSNFAGPRVAYSELSSRHDKADGAMTGYELEGRTLSTVFEIENAGQCGLGPTALLSTPGLAQSEELFECAGALYGYTAGAKRADIQVDGTNVYDPYAANELYSKLAPAASITIKPTFDAATGLTTIHETDPLLECKGTSQSYPQTSESCEALMSSGVELERTWTPSEGGRLITVSDAWRSTDGSEHAVSLLYQEELNSDLSSPGTFEFPGAAPSFATTKSGQSIELGAGGGTILYRENGTAAEAAGSAHPVGALIYATAPSEAVQATAGSAETNGLSSLTIPYSFEVGSSAATTVKMGFAEGYTVAEVCALAEGFGSSCPQASEAERHEAEETKETTATTGTTQTASSTTATPTATTGSTGPTAHRTAAARLLKGNIVISLSCSGSSGTNCSVRTALTTLEKLRGGRPTGLAASIRTVTVGSLAASIAAGTSRTLTIKLNATGRALLAHFHKLPLHISVVQQNPSGAKVSIASQSLTIVLLHH